MEGGGLGCSDTAALWSALMGHVYCTTLSSGTDKMVTVTGGGGKKKPHRMKVLQLKHTDKWVSNKPLSDIFHPGNCGTGSCVPVWWSVCVTWWIVVYCGSARLKKQKTKKTSTNKRLFQVGQSAWPLPLLLAAFLSITYPNYSHTWHRLLSKRWH